MGEKANVICSLDLTSCHRLLTCVLCICLSVGVGVGVGVDGCITEKKRKITFGRKSESVGRWGAGDCIIG